MTSLSDFMIVRNLSQPGRSVSTALAVGYESDTMSTDLPRVSITMQLALPRCHCEHTSSVSTLCRDLARRVASLPARKLLIGACAGRVSLRRMTSADLPGARRDRAASTSASRAPRPVSFAASQVQGMVTAAVRRAPATAVSIARYDLRGGDLMIIRAFVDNCSRCIMQVL